MADYIRPCDNYTSNEKQNSRVYFNNVLILHKVIERMQADSTLYLVLVPCVGGEQIKLAVERGIPQSQILAFDRDISILQKSEWRKQYPDVNLLGMEAYHGLNWWFNMVRGGVGSVIAFDLDLCGNISNKTEKSFKGFIENSPIALGCIGAFTIAKGREWYLSYIKANSLKAFGNFIFTSVRIGYLASLDFIKNRCTEILKESNHKPKGYGTRMERLIAKF